MKEWIEELLAEKAGLQQQLELMARLIAYVDQEHDDDTPISMEALQEEVPPQISVDEEGVHLNYASTL